MSSSTSIAQATLPTISIAGIDACRLIIGGNPFSGFSHQSPKRSQEMRDWYTDERIVDTLLEAAVFVANGGTVSIAAGTSGETIVINKDVSLVASSGPVTIGAP